MTTRTCWHQPATLDEALGLLSSESGARAFAGGTDILPALHRDPHCESLRYAPRPAPDPETVLVGLGRIPGLGAISREGAEIRIGALATHAAVASSDLVRRAAPALALAAAWLGTPQVRNRGTLGGNIMSASPAADTVVPLVALDASVTLRSVRGERRIGLAGFFRGPGKTRADRDELLIAVHVPLEPARPQQDFRRLAARRYHACAKVSVAVCCRREDDVLHHVRVALGAVGPTVIAAVRTAALLEGRRLTDGLAAKACETVRTEVAPITDIRSTREYRTAMCGELLRQGLESLRNDRQRE